MSVLETRQPSQSAVGQEVFLGDECLTRLVCVGRALDVSKQACSRGGDVSVVVELQCVLVDGQSGFGLLRVRSVSEVEVWFLSWSRPHFDQLVLDSRIERADLHPLNVLG